ncbi:aspartate/glutamate racemase family protein [Roseburia intestinalis]|jgi:aspartate racemase|uniref:Aspartate/glutamate racemase family protein n=1 Tax=Roseburia intestinalis TaxID=166486 RepID=A0A414T312_9FIRM|nr:amino acid racemase [Roseburia intestinalis]RHG28625.1 aspartate/glutamate racemase family protein [Roseburia intestinalis]
MYSEKIGIIGGFGAYAGLDFYKRLLECFSTGNERDYPHVIMDNNFTMPSRTRALLYDECVDEIVKDIADSVRLMLSNEVDKIVLVCGTAHYFLEQVYELLPEAREHIVDIIDCLGERLQKEGITECFVIAAEGALKKELYKKRLKEYGVKCIVPEEDEYGQIRCFIEAVKRHSLEEDTVAQFLSFLKKYACHHIVLGCTEFPVLVDYIKNIRKKELEPYFFYDPLEEVIINLKRDLR